jgi:hypothetical protein
MKQNCGQKLISSSSCSYSWRFSKVILFLNPQDGVGHSISSSVVPCSLIHSVYIAVDRVTGRKTTATTAAALSANPTPTSTKAEAAWPLGNAADTAADGRGCRRKASALNWTHSAKTAQSYIKSCRSTGIKATQPLDSPCDRPVTYPGDSKIS